MRKLNSQLLTVLGSLTNPIRLRVISFLRDNDNANYSDLIKACNLSSYSESGKLGYNLNKLSSLGLIAKDEAEYMLTGKGRRASKLIELIKERSDEFILQKTESERNVDIEKLEIRKAEYSDLIGLIELGKVGFLSGEEMPDYHVAMYFVDQEGIRTKNLSHQGSGKGRLTYVAEYDGELIGYCTFDLLSLASMKAEYLPNIEENLPEELRITSSEKDFFENYWETNSKFMAAYSLTAYLEVEYGVTGTWSAISGPIQLVFTRKRLDTDEFVTADTKEILHQMLLYEEIEERRWKTYRKTLQEIDSDDISCYIIFCLFAKSGFNTEQVKNAILKYVEKKAIINNIKYLITSVSPKNIDERNSWKNNGFTEYHKPHFEYKHAGNVETYVEIKKIS
jgi:predicted transcriptional regulator